MNFDLDDDQERWRQEVRDFLAANCSGAFHAEVREVGFEAPGPEQREFWRKVAQRGWLGLNLPAKYGGLARGPVEQHILINEFEYWGAHRPGLEVTSIAPMILRYGTEQNKDEFLPLIAKGELVVAVGYSEPNAGTDLASLRTRAELVDDEWVINGQKIWNSYADVATHEWLCVRTDPAAPKHKGISVIMVPIDTPGIEIRPLITWNDMRTNEAFFTDVRVPRTNLIGEVNRGWEYITGALDLERSVVTNAGDLRRTVDELISAARETLPDGRRPADDAVLRRTLAQLDAEVDVAQVMGLEACSLLEGGTIPSVAVTVEKIHSTELRQRIADVATRLYGMYGVLAGDDEDAQVAQGAEKLYRAAPLMRFGGGTNEVLRDAIARRGYGLPGITLMRIVPTPEQRELQGMLRHLFADACPPSVVRAAKDGSTVDEPWRTLAKHDLLGLAVPSEFGGDGLDSSRLGVLFEEAGRVLCPTSVYSTLVAGLALDRLGSPEQRARHLPALAAGDLHATTALWDAADASNLQPAFAAVAGDRHRVLDGTAMFVTNAVGADLVVVSALDDRERVVMALVEPASDARWSATPLTTLDRSPLAHVRLSAHAADSVPVRAGDVQWVAQAAVALQCMEMVGGAAAVLDRTVAYVKEREQFGRPLGSFQAVRQHVANMRIALDLARLSAWQATWRLGQGGVATRAVAIAKMHSSDAYKTITLTAHQLHGGMGYVRETDLHLWSERAKVTEIQGGTADVAAKWLERELGLVGSDTEPRGAGPGSLTR